MTAPETTVWLSPDCIQQHSLHRPYDSRPCPGSSIDLSLASAQGCKPQTVYRGGRLLPAHPDLGVVSWNVEGLTDEKLETLQVYMVQMNVGIIALQETHTCNSEYYVTHRGYLVVLSGPVGDRHDSAGVGFIVAPWLRQSVVGFCQASSRMASLKLRIKGGKAAFISAYAPHSGKHYDERQAFYHELGEFIARTTAHGPKFVLGDFNARIYRRLSGEEELIGNGVFTNSEATIPDKANRHLLVEMCESQGLAVANTFFNNLHEELVTCYNVGCTEQKEISWQCHSQIDFVLCSQAWLPCVIAAGSNRRWPLASHHYPMISALQLQVPKHAQKLIAQQHLISSLSSPVVANRFAEVFEMQVEMAVSEDTDNIDLFYAGLVDAFATAEGNTLPRRTAVPKRPWISNRTLALIEERCIERRRLHLENERRLTKAIKSSIKNDRAVWLESILASGDWGEIRKLRKGQKVAQGRLKNMTGEMVSSDCRAETLAEHLEKVQWTVRPTTLGSTAPITDKLLPVKTAEISEEELIKAAKSLKKNRAMGLDGVPSEFWKIVLLPGSEGARRVLQFCNLCWKGRKVPQAWHEARVTSIFKKGDPSSCDNYRPISLLNIAYKMFAAILLNRLRDAGADERLWRTQFGFRRRRGTQDALFIARRQIERTWAQKDGKVVLLALDWAKAFDSVSPRSLAVALRRFGLPKEFVEMIEAIYCDRTFFVKDAGSTSERHRQEYGISQGCPLSPYLFVILMTVLMTDAKATLAGLGVELHEHCLVHDLVYADDTLLIDVDENALATFMECVGAAGQEYGLSFNFTKLEAMPVRMEASIHTPNGNIVENKHSMVYLGSSLSSDGSVAAEVGRRIGQAKADLDGLRKVWSHSSMTTARKLCIYDACVVSKLVYGLHTATLNKSERCRLDGFHARCLRRILRIQHAYHSRVSNKTVLERAGATPLSTRILQQQLLYLGEIARRDHDDPVRCCVFLPGSLDDIPVGPRKQGRPRHTWVGTVCSTARQIAGTLTNFRALMAPSAQAIKAWRATVLQSFNNYIL